MSHQFDIVIGLEIHAQMATDSKCFSTASTDFGSSNNENVTAVCAGLPGTLPVLNDQAVKLSMKTALALNCDIQKQSVFSRKQYFYPDMPKGYQVTQYDQPIALGGWVDFVLDGEEQRVHLERAHMEEDAGKSTHFGEYSLINLNRSGVPLLEIVSKPEITSPAMAAAYARAVRQILRYAEVCDGNLEQGSMRCDCNVSIKRKGDPKLGTKVELKNINSFRFIEKALEYEVDRQIHCFENNEPIVQETRLYDSVKNKTFSMRKKEGEKDYRYFPEPDLMPLFVTDEEITTTQQSLPEMPMAKRSRYISSFGLNAADADLLVEESSLAQFFEDINEQVDDPKLVSNWVSGEFLRLYNESQSTWQNLPVSAKMFSELLSLIQKKEISGKMAKEVLDEMWASGRLAKEIIQEKGLSQISDPDQIFQIISETLKAHEAKIEEYRQGKEKLYGFFVGQVMKATKGQANPDEVNIQLKRFLKG